MLTIYVLSKNKKNITYFSQENCHFVNQKNHSKYYDPHKAQISCAVTPKLCLCKRYMDSTIPLLPKSEISIKPLTIFCGCTARFVSDLAVFAKNLLSVGQNRQISEMSGKFCQFAGQYVQRKIIIQKKPQTVFWVTLSTKDYDR